MNLFKFKRRGSDKIETFAANTADEVIEIHKGIGVDIDVLGIESNTSSIMKSVTVEVPAVSEAEQKAKQEEKFFTINNVECKLVNGAVYNKAWIDVNMNEYRIVSVKGRKQIQKLDWVPIINE